MASLPESAIPSDQNLFKTVAVWWPTVVGMAALFLPTYLWMATTIWQTDANGHGPLVAAVAVWAFWKNRSVLQIDTIASRTLPGGILFAIGILGYVLGRSQSMPSLEILSHVPILVGIVLITLGTAALRRLWFPLLFLLFLVPVPSFVVDSTTGPLKQAISEIVTHLLYWLGYPIAREGVVLQVGQYQLLVADACSGLNSMFSISAIGIIYLYLMAHTSKLRNLIVLLFLWPIAFAANALRVLILVLITYHVGDEAAQGFVHQFAGIMVFLLSLFFMMSVDKVLGYLFPDSPRTRLA